MQGRVWHGKIFAHFAKNDLFLTTLEYAHPPPPRHRNGKLARTWDFEFWVVKKTHPQPHPENDNLELECVESNIPKGYRLVTLDSLV